MEIIGRVTADATVNMLKDGRKVVQFSIAINDRFKSKGSGQTVTQTTFYNCSYWVNEGIAKYLLKGSLVEMFGSLRVNTYLGIDGNPKASLNVHVSHIKLHGQAKSPAAADTPLANKIGTGVEPVEDLPF